MRPTTSHSIFGLLLPCAALLLASCDVGELDEGDDLETIAAAGCSPAATDPDRDGWGWEPARTCVVAGSGRGDGSYPTCSSAATDPERDGWGWEPARSCQMRVATPTIPTCSSRATDPDGDGWGWEPDTRVSCRMPTGGGGGGSLAGACQYVDGSCAVNGSCGIYNDAGARGGVKREIWQQMYAVATQGLAGLSAAEAERRRAEGLCRADLAVAMAMQESHSFAVDGSGQLPYDWTKDGATDGSQNVCVFNMNIDFLKRSCKSDCGRFQSFTNQDEKKYLNRRTSLPECVRRLNEAFNHFGIDGTLHFHRGGSTGWQNPGDDERAFARAQKVVADHLRDNQAYRTNEARVSQYIPHR